MSYQEIFMQRAVELAKECATFDEVPVGAVVVKNGRIVAESGNRKERENNAVCHAEIVAISEATKAQNNWWLEDCDIYVTLEPCAMCAGAMINSRIRALYFGAYDEKTGACGSKINLFEQGLFNHDVEVSGGHLQDECSKLLSAFFRKKRKAKTEDKNATE
ncbi:MAG: tRNA adenosine(34) deaminase TadA [Christensenellales bacterium]